MFSAAPSGGSSLASSVSSGVSLPDEIPAPWKITDTGSAFKIADARGRGSLRDYRVNRQPEGTVTGRSKY